MDNVKGGDGVMNFIPEQFTATGQSNMHSTPLPYLFLITYPIPSKTKQ